MNNRYPEGHAFAHLKPSDTPENIYYADLFEINGRNWVIQGYGKTDAARIASNRKLEAMFATDAVAIVRDGDSLFGRYDPGALTTQKPEMHRLHWLSAIAYCLDEEQTEWLASQNDGKREIAVVGNGTLAALCATYPYPANMAPHFFSESEYMYFANPTRMAQHFAALTQNIVDTKFLLVPFMPTVEAKAALYSNFVF